MAEPRYDSIGRRIGYNWWREYNTDLLLHARHAWEEQRENEALGYGTEMSEFAEQNPRPTLKAFLLANKGMNDLRDSISPEWCDTL